MNGSWGLRRQFYMMDLKLSRTLMYVFKMYQALANARLGCRHQEFGARPDDGLPLSVLAS